MKLVLFILICAGITNSVANNGFFNFLRNTKSKFVNKLFACSLCFGFWVGMLVHYISDVYKVIIEECYLYRFTDNMYIDMILYGFISSYCCYLLCNLAGRYEKTH